MMNALSSTHGNIFQVKVPFSFRKKLSAFAIGQCVIAKYENCYYPGEVLKVPPGTSAKICTLERSGKKFWKCPGREDVKYAIQDIIKTTKTSTVVSHLGTTFCYWIWLSRVFLSIPIGCKQFEQCWQNVMSMSLPRLFQPLVSVGYVLSWWWTYIVVFYLFFC